MRSLLTKIPRSHPTLIKSGFPEKGPRNSYFSKAFPVILMTSYIWEALPSSINILIVNPSAERNEIEDTVWLLELEHFHQNN